MKTLFLHIGTRKTGTTAIQSFCGKNRAVLESKGYCYPAIEFPYSLGKNRNAHFMISIVREEGERNYAEEERLFSLGMDEVHRCFQEYDNVVMSDEDLWHYSVLHRKDFWNKLKADAQEYGYTVKIIVYLRRQDELLESNWNQAIKMGTNTQTWEKYVRKAPVKLKYLLDYAANLKRIAKVFGKENILVRRYNRDSFYKGTIYADFFQCLGLELTDEYEEPEEEANPRLKGNMVEIRRVMNTLPVLYKNNNMYWRKLLVQCSEASEDNRKYSMFSREEAEEFINRYREGNEKIAADFIGDGKPLFHYDVADIPKWEKHNEYMLDDVIRVFAMMAYDSYESIMALQEQVRTLKRKQEENRLSMDNIARKGKRYIYKKLGMKHE